MFRRAKEGLPTLSPQLVMRGLPSSQPVVKEIKEHLQTNGPVAGSAVLKNFQAAPYGWPKGHGERALAILVLSEDVSVWDGSRQVPAAQLTESVMTRLQYRVEQVTLTFAQRQKLKAAGQCGGSEQNPVDVAGCLGVLLSVAAAAGGVPPLPASPDTTEIIQLESKIGAERDAAVANSVDDLITSSRPGKRKQPRLLVVSLNGMRSLA